MSENHPAYSSVKWEVLPFFCLRVSWMQSAGLGHVQVASVYGKGSFESRSQAAPLQASTGWNIHESPWLMIPIPAALVCPKTCEEDASHLSIGRTHHKWGIFTQSWSRHSRESLSQPRWNRFKHTHSQQPGGGAHTTTLTTLNSVCWGQACCRANRYVSLRAVLQSCLMSHSALVIFSAWFRGLLCGNRWNKSKALLGAMAHSQLCSPSQGPKAQAYIPTNQQSWASIKTSCQDAREIFERMSCDSHSVCHGECSISCWTFQLMASICWLQDDQDQVRHRTEYCSRVFLTPSMADYLWWQDPLAHLRPCLDSASFRSGAV